MRCRTCIHLPTSWARLRKWHGIELNWFGKIGYWWHWAHWTWTKNTTIVSIIGIITLWCKFLIVPIAKQRHLHRTFPVLRRRGPWWIGVSADCSCCDLFLCLYFLFYFQLLHCFCGCVELDVEKKQLVWRWENMITVSGMNFVCFL